MNALQAFLISHEILLWVEDIADKLGLNQMSLQVSFDREQVAQGFSRLSL